MYSVIDDANGIEILYGSKCASVHSSAGTLSEDIAKLDTLVLGTMETSPSSGSSIYHTPRSFGGTPRVSNLSEGNGSGDRGSSDDNSKMNGEDLLSRNSSEDVYHYKTNGTKSSSDTSEQHNEESKYPYEEDTSPKEMSRRLVEYFVVVSSVPKARKVKECDSSKGSTKQNNDVESVDASSRRSHRIGSRRAHLEVEGERRGTNASGGSSRGSALTTDTAVADKQKVQSATNEFSALPSIPIEVPSTPNSGVSISGESISPYKKSDSMFSDERSSVSTGTQSTAKSLKKNFLNSMNKHKKKIKENTEKMNATIQANAAKMNATGLKNLEKTLGGLDKTFMSMNLTPKEGGATTSWKSPMTSTEKDAGRNKPKKRPGDGEYLSSSSGSSISLDGVTPNTDASTFQPSRNVTSARNRTPMPFSPTLPEPPPPALISLPGSSNTLRGASENIRMSPLPDRHLTPKGPTDNIRVGHEKNNSVGSRGDGDVYDFTLEPVVTAQYPVKDHPDQPLNPMIHQFCHPHGIDSILPLHEFKMPTVHHFVLTDSKGGKLYGTCLTVHEEFLPHSGEVQSRRGEDSKKYYAPRVLCLLSTWPYLSAFRTYLTQLYRLVTTTNLMTAPLERYIENICSEVPAPPPGLFEVKMEILGTTIKFWAPPADQPIPYVSLPYGVLFECLDIGNVLFAWYTLACERKLLLVSSQLSLLAVCGEILCSMLFPMKWSHLYIPNLPKFLTPMLDAPMPYLCGISREIFPHAVADISDETVVVDLDRNVVTLGKLSSELPFLPHKRKQKLKDTLEQHAGDVFWNVRGLTTAEVEEARLDEDEDKLARMLGVADSVWDERICTMDDAYNLAHGPASMSLLHYEEETDRKQSRWDAVQEGFLRFYVSMLKDYRKFMPSVPTNKQSSWRGPGAADDGRFLTEDFVLSQPPDFQPFLKDLTGTQMFDDFVTRRMYNAEDAPDIKFFDQSIDAKKNRSKLQLKKKDTPFLHSAIAHRQLKQVDAIEPNAENIPHRSRFDTRLNFKKGAYNYLTWPESFDESFFGKPRPIPNIITAEFDRRSALAAMLRAKHGVAMGKRLSGGNNPSPEATAFVLFFVTFSNTIGKEWALLEKERAMIAENLLDQSPDGISSTDSPMSEGPWKPKVNPPWMGGEDFRSLHTTFRPSPKKPDPPEDLVFDDNNGPSSNDFWDPDCPNFCAGKVINPSTYIGIPWATSDNATTATPEIGYVKNALEEERENEMEKARSIAKAQIDLGFNTLDMMRLRKLPTEPITYKTLIEACGRCGIAHRVHQLMEMMTQDGMALDSEVYFSFIKAISHSANEPIPQQSREIGATDASSEFAANKTSYSATSSGFSFLNSSYGEDQSTKLRVKGSGSKFMDGFQHAMTSTIETNRRAFKASKTKRLKRLLKQNLTKKKDLHVTDAITTHLELGYCILEDLYPGINIDRSDTCPKCSRILSQDNIILGWKPCQVEDFSTMCPSCKHRFVPKFSVSCNLESFEGSQGKGTPLYCDYLSPWVILRMTRSLLKKSVSCKAAKILGAESNEAENIGIDAMIDPTFREGSGINATLWWNMIVTFARFKIPYTFLLQGSYKDQQLIMPTLEDT